MKIGTLFFCIIFLFSFTIPKPDFKNKLKSTSIKKIDLYLLSFQFIRNQPISPNEFMKFYDIRLTDNWSVNIDYSRIKDLLLNLEKDEREILQLDIRLMTVIYLKNKKKLKLYISKNGSIQIDGEIYKPDKEHSLLKELLVYFSDSYKPTWIISEKN